MPSTTDNHTKEVDNVTDVEPETARDVLIKEEPDVFVAPEAQASIDAQNIITKLPDRSVASDFIADKNAKDDAVATQHDESADLAVKIEPNCAGLTITEANALGLLSRELPTSAAKLKTSLFDPGRSDPPPRLLSWYAIQIKNHPNKPLSETQRQAVYDITKSLFEMKEFATDPNVRLKELTDFKNWLRLIMGETSDAFKGAVVTFPAPFPDDAATVVEHLDMTFGFETIEDDHPPFPEPEGDSKKRKRSSKESPRPAARETINLEDDEFKSMMHNIRRTSASRKTFEIADKTKIRSSAVTGHNDLRIGRWWPYRLCALRDGAHGSFQGGIAGNGREGAKSIVIGRGYADMDNDKGTTIYYSGSNSHANTSATTPHLSAATKWMQLSAKNGTSIRVLRTDQGNWKGKPSVGIRYDGLYKIVDVQEPFNKKGGKYVRFVLKREGGQEGIVRGRPTVGQREVYWKLRNSV